MILDWSTLVVHGFQSLNRPLIQSLSFTKKNNYTVYLLPINALLYYVLGIMIWVKFYFKLVLYGYHEVAKNSNRHKYCILGSAANSSIPANYLSNVI